MCICCNLELKNCCLGSNFKLNNTSASICLLFHRYYRYHFILQKIAVTVTASINYLSFTHFK